VAAGGLKGGDVPCVQEEEEEGSNHVLQQRSARLLVCGRAHFLKQLTMQVNQDFN